MRWLWLALWLTPAAAAAQGLTLGEALRRADQSAYPVRIAAGEQQDRAGQAAMARRAFLPAVRLEAGYVRTTDPLGAFGTLLRRREVTQAAFEPARLNDPDAIGLLSTAVVLEQPLFNLDAWFGRRAAGEAARAGAASLEWTRSATGIQVLAAYFGAILAREQERTLVAGLEAARGNQARTESLYRNGMITRSDVLLAQLRVGEIEAELLGASAGVAQARRALATMLGSPGDTLETLPATLPSSTCIQDLARRPLEPGSRADLAAARLGAEAANQDLRRATAALVPRLNSFARLDWNSAEAPFAGTSGWTVGLQVSWTPFSGGTELADRQAAAGRSRSAVAGYEAARAQALLEQRQAEADVAVALARLDIAERAVRQSEEARRLVARRYEGGLATVSELLEATALETGSRLALSRQQYDTILALGNRLRATGNSVFTMTALDLPESSP